MFDMADLSWMQMLASGMVRVNGLMLNPTEILHKLFVAQAYAKDKKNPLDYSISRQPLIVGGGNSIRFEMTNDPNIIGHCRIIMTNNGDELPVRNSSVRNILDWFKSQPELAIGTDGILYLRQGKLNLLDSSGFNRDFNYKQLDRYIRFCLKKYNRRPDDYVVDIYEEDGHSFSFELWELHALLWLIN